MTGGSAKRNAALQHPPISRVKIIHRQKETYPSGKLMANRRDLGRCGGAGYNNVGLRLDIGRHRHPTFTTPKTRVLNQSKPSLSLNQAMASS